MVAAGAVVEPGTVVPAGEIWGGKPAKQLRSLQPKEQAFLKGTMEFAGVLQLIWIATSDDDILLYAESAEHYVNVSSEHLKNGQLSLLDIAKQKGLAK